MPRKPSNKDIEKGIVKHPSTEELLRKNKEIYQSVFTNSPVGISIYDETGQCVEANDSIAKLVGATKEQVLQQNYHQIESWKKSGLLEKAKNAIKENKPKRHEFLLQTSFGADVKLECHLFPIASVGLILMVNDITESKEAVDTLRESGEKFRNLFSNSPMGIFVYKLGKDGTLIFQDANQGADRILGVNCQQFVGKTIEEAFPPLADTEVPERYMRAAIYGETWETEQIDYSHGEISGAFRVVAFQTKPNEMACIFEDITLRKRTEKALQESEERFRELAELLPETIFETDPVGNLTFVNRNAYKQFKYEPQEFTKGLNALDMIISADHNRAIENIQQILNGEHIGLQEYTALRKDGSVFPALIHSTAIFQEGKPVGLRGFIIDITEKIRLESQLQHAQKMESIGTLAGGIAHDFNNILMGIQGRASLLMSDINTKDPFYEHVKGIEEYVKSASELTKQLLGFARGGKYEVIPASINEILESTVSMFIRTKKEIRIEKILRKDVWTIEVDRGQIKQVFLNLFVNAWQAMPGGGTIYLQTENATVGNEYVKPFQLAPGNYVKVSVTDTGAGMDAITKSKIFDPFFTTKELGRGTGLGLASAYGIIKNHDGLINVYSELGQGTTFNIYLPASEKVVNEAVDIKTELISGTGVILFVDDEKMILDVGKPMLERLGYRVYTANNGTEAVKIFKKRKKEIDLVILDMVMPDMSGGEVFDQIKQVDTDVKVLLSSGYSINGQASEILKKGCRGFIQKPFSINDLSSSIEKILE